MYWIANIIEKCANICRSYVYPVSDALRYIPGESATAAVALVVAVLAFVIRAVLKKQNKALAGREVVDAENSVMSLHGGNPEARAADLGIFCGGNSEKPRRISVRITVSSSLVKDVAVLWLNLGGLEREVS